MAGSQHKSPPRYREKDSRMPNWIELPVNHQTIIIIILIVMILTIIMMIFPR